MSAETKQPEPALPETPAASEESALAQPSAADGNFFKHRKEAWMWLKSQGYKVSQGKFYMDIEATGFPVVSSDGSLSRYQVQVYGQNLAAKKQRVSTPEELSRFDSQYRADKAKAELLELELAEKRRESDAAWLRAADAWSVIAYEIGELKSAVRRKLYDELPALVDAVGGDRVRAPELYEALEGVVDEVWNDMAERGIDVEWEQ